MTQAAGAYEPGLATVIDQVRTKAASKEPIIAPVDFCKRHIRFRSISTGSAFSEDKQNSQQVLSVWMRSDTKTRKINTGMQIVHNGLTYSILGKVTEIRFVDEVGFKVCSTS